MTCFGYDELSPCDSDVLLRWGWPLGLTGWDFGGCWGDADQGVTAGFSGPLLVGKVTRGNVRLCSS